MKKIALFIIVLNLAISISADVFTHAKQIGRGVNLGNCFEAPNEGDWGEIAEEEYFKIISEKGFNSIRIPIRWSAHIKSDSPFSLDTVFLKRIDWAIENSLKNGLITIIDIHHYDSININPDGEKSRFLSIWRELAEYYKDYSDSLYFEILNEPHDNLTTDKWNTLFNEALEIIRMNNPTRTVIIGTANWGGVSELYKLELPKNDSNIIATVHYYSPFHFTHQGASWVKGADEWLGTVWSGSFAEKSRVKEDADRIKKFGEENHIPIFIGEFGAFSKADIKSRSLWTQYCARLFEKSGFSWAYWEFSSGFGVYDNDSKSWNTPILSALISDDTACLDLNASVFEKRSGEIKFGKNIKIVTDKNRIIINSNLDNILKYRVVNIQGKDVFSDIKNTKTDIGKTVLIEHNLPSGIYLIEIETAKNGIVGRKLMLDK